MIQFDFVKKRSRKIIVRNKRPKYVRNMRNISHVYLILYLSIGSVTSRPYRKSWQTDLLTNWSTNWRTWGVIRSSTSNNYQRKKECLVETTTPPPSCYSNQNRLILSNLIRERWEFKKERLEVKHAKNQEKK